jgi:predicted chitinase
MLDFLTVYSATQKDGSWDSLKIGSTTDPVQQAKIRAALFGTGVKIGGLIDSSKVLLGGMATTLGSQMTGKSLGLLMGNVRGVNYADWVKPLQQAMAKFNINTPQRIAAFFAQIRMETGGLKTLLEKDNNWTVHNLSRSGGLFGNRFMGQSGHTDTAGRPLTWAQYLGRANSHAPLSSETTAKAIANRAYGFVSRFPIKNGNTSFEDGWNFRGRGPFHLTGRSNYERFAVDLFGRRSTQYNQIMTTPSVMDNDPYLLALSAADFWSIHNKNNNADILNENATTPPNLTPLPAKPNVPYYHVGNQYTDLITQGIATAVGSFSIRFNYWRANVSNAHTGGNPYESMIDVLNRVGINAVNTQGYQSQFGISLHVQKPLEIGGGIHSLMAAPIKNDAAAPADIVLSEPMQTLLTDARNTLGFNEGEYTMFIAAQPDAPPSMPSVVMVAQANISQQAAIVREHVLGVCDLVNMTGEGQADLFPVINVNGGYFNTAKIDRSTAKISIIQQPKHGRLEPTNSDGDWTDSRYLPNDGYLGKDSFILQVEGNGYTVKIHYFLLVTDDQGVTWNPNCTKGATWKISSTLAPNSNSVLTAVDYLPSPDISASVTGATLASVLGKGLASSLDANTTGVTLSIADLPGGAVGETTGTSITLDTNAAGYGWYIDPNPSSNADFLPTSNPDVWMAKPGSAAAGKMDMLSVLLHEYGHALGLDHSANPNDFMAPNLQPGERRLPSSAELAQLSQLSNSLSSVPGPLPSDPALPVGTALSALLIGRLRRTGYGSWTPVIDSIQIPAPQFERAVTLCNLSVRLNKMEPQGNNGIE